MTSATGCARRSRGRPKVFDRDAALDKAMALFWQHGYEATSMAHLVEITGAKAPTLYAEFTNKEGLFRAALDRYIALFIEKNETLLFAASSSLEQALGDYLCAIAHSFTSQDTPNGCFIISTSSALAASSEEIANTIKAEHARQARSIRRFLQQRQQQGEIPLPCNIDHVTDYLCCILQGMSVSAREGASFATLKQVVETTLRILPELIKN